MDDFVWCVKLKYGYPYDTPVLAEPVDIGVIVQSSPQNSSDELYIIESLETSIINTQKEINNLLPSNDCDFY